ncbi:hypothetical protein FA13DRAFT_1723745 [Coprinellus micaceus]|uniref:Uncharacterized protein n=1 Tax=Coprinellus micaceus TaxID=71717 RepID=A0A4Y7TZE3_COPMI|nr:hypothetical protein FA13DRAFT_1723745 [Coprinellus micaceus]
MPRIVSSSPDSPLLSVLGDKRGKRPTQKVSSDANLFRLADSHTMKRFTSAATSIAKTIDVIKVPSRYQTKVSQPIANRSL